MALRLPHDPEDEEPAFGWRQAATLAATALSIAVVGGLVAFGLRQWRAYDARTDAEALADAMAPGFPRWRQLEPEHGFSGSAPARRDRDRMSEPDEERRGHWVDVSAYAVDAPGRGAVLELDADGTLVLSDTHPRLPDRIRADRAEDVRWVVFFRRTQLEGAYYFETHPVSVERLELHMVTTDGVRLADAAAESVPPALVPRSDAPRDAYRLPTSLPVRLIRRLVDTTHPTGAQGARESST